MHSLTSLSKPNHLFRFSQSLSSHFQTLINSNTSLIRSSRLPNIPTESINFDPQTVEQTLISYGSDWKRAFDFFNWLENKHNFKHNLNTYNRMIDVLGKFSQFDLAWDLIEQMPKPDHATFRIMFKRYVSAHKAQQAIDTYNDRMGAYSLKDETSFTNLIDALCEYRHIMDAEGLFKSSLHCYDTKLNNMMLRGYSKIRWWKKCNEFWEEMERNGVAPDIHTYSIYMDIQTKCGKPWRAIKLYKEMKTNGIQLDVAAYNTVVRAAGLAQGVDDAIQVYREMKDFGVEPNIVTYNTIVKLLCEEGRVRQAYRLLDRMPERGCVPDVITYNCMFGSLERPKEILTLFERMEESGVSPRMDTYVMLLKKFGRWGLLRPIFIVWEKMKKHGVSPDEFAYSALIDALMEKGMIDMARKYEMEMLEKDLPVRSPKELGTKLSGRERDTE